ncbi:hypothetical protein EVAR_61810_1 [Eumeta japonica]|uniref:Uncharacterized protein n=1 Tax=Eumeta variegata TaxID=151549 RepID=A0A4C1YSX7_EUMVA|nr:hypothetical protein EVAR_61810_1 [Eumeta japonica]
MHWRGGVVIERGMRERKKERKRKCKKPEADPYELRVPSRVSVSARVSAPPGTRDIYSQIDRVLLNFHTRKHQLVSHKTTRGNRRHPPLAPPPPAAACRHPPPATRSLPAQ